MVRECGNLLKRETFRLRPNGRINYLKKLGEKGVITRNPSFSDSFDILLALVRPSFDN
jgi:hypothetical protein